MKQKKAIVVLAGGFSRDESGSWHSSPFGQLATVSVSGSYVRIAAAAILWRQDPQSVVVTSGGRAKADALLPSGLFLSSVMKGELMAEGVPETAILEENRSGSTFQQLVEIANLVREHGWQRVQIVSNRFHLPRIRAIIECLEKLSPLKPVVEYVSAEDIVLEAESQKWREAIERAYNSDEFAKIIEAEERGISQIRAGTYRAS